MTKRQGKTGENEEEGEFHCKSLRDSIERIFIAPTAAKFTAKHSSWGVKPEVNRSCDK